MKFTIGVDIGGTFTDTTILRDDGAVTTFKTPSTPAAPELGVFLGVTTAMERAGLAPEDCVALVNSSTVGVNAIVQRRGANVGVIVTEGFEDFLEIGRAKMSELFKLDAKPHAPLVRKPMVRGVRERIDASGKVLCALDVASLTDAAGSLIDAGAESLAILFLHAHRNAQHEELAKQLITKAYPDITVAISSEVWPQIREYERATVLVMNSYIAPKVGRYISELDRRKNEIGLTCDLYISGSNGGVLPAEHAVKRSITTLLSGPSAGIVATVRMMRDIDIDRAITLDVGGTSADICVLKEPEIPYAWGQEIEGLPIAIPYVDVSSIGAGGGSLAQVDNVGLLRVGPDSAGSVPGPAAYGRGGTQATLTDAFLVSGFIDPDNFAGGDLKLDLSLAEAAVRPIAERLGCSLQEAAAGIVRVTNSNLVAEFTRLTARNGVDLRDFALVPFGGAGPTQACILADELKMREVAIPRSPGTFCALGAILADFRLDYLRTAYRQIKDISGDAVRDWYKSVESQGSETLKNAAGQIARIEVVQTADVRYLGQGHEVAINFKRLADIPSLFKERYRNLYGPRQDDSPIEIINFRATVVGRRESGSLSYRASGSRSGASGSRSVFIDGRQQSFPIYRREELAADWTADGPFLIDQADTTCVVTAGWSGRLAPSGTVLLSKGL